MSKLLIALLFSAFSMTTFAADTDHQANGAELGTQETPQAQDQSKNSKSTATHKHSTSKKRNHMQNKAKHNHSKAGSSEENPLQPTESEPAPGASTK